MKLKLLTDLPLEPVHGMLTGGEYEIYGRQGPGYLVKAKPTGENVVVLPRECELTPPSKEEVEQAVRVILARVQMGFTTVEAVNGIKDQFFFGPFWKDVREVCKEDCSYASASAKEFEAQHKFHLEQIEEGKNFRARQL